MPELEQCIPGCDTGRVLETRRNEFLIRSSVRAKYYYFVAQPVRPASKSHNAFNAKPRQYLSYTASNANPGHHLTYTASNEPALVAPALLSNLCQGMGRRTRV